MQYVAEMRAGTRTEWEHEKRYIRKDGTTAWGHASVALVDDIGGHSHVVSLVQDITKRREAESIFGAVFAQSVVPKLIANDDRQLVELNASARAFLGIDRETALTLTIDDLMPDLALGRSSGPKFVRDGTLEAEATPQAPGRRSAPDRVRRDRKRPPRPSHRGRARPLAPEGARVAAAPGAEDGGGRSARRRDRPRLQQPPDRDLRLQRVPGEAASRTLALKRHAEEIKKAAARAANLTGQLLAFSRRQVLQPRVLDLNAVVSDMDSLLRRLIGEDVELVTMLEPGLRLVQADPTQIEQVIVNLAVNARDAMPNGGSVTIETANIVTDKGVVRAAAA